MIISSFTGYENEAEVNVSDLQRSNGKKCRERQKRTAHRMLVLDADVEEEECSVEQEYMSPLDRAIEIFKRDSTKLDQLSSSRVESKNEQEFTGCLENSQSHNGNASTFPDPVQTQNDLRKLGSKGSFEAATSTLRNPHTTRTPDPDAHWSKSFPKLFMPPMPTSLANSKGKVNYGKGELSSLLMTWYMSGYHAGYYDAKQDIKKKLRNKDSTLD